MSKYKQIRDIGTAGVVAVLSLMAVPATAGAAGVQVTEYYNGQTFVLSPDNWNGATDCAFTDPSEAYCFDSEAALAAFTSVPRDGDGSAAGPASSGTCNGWAAIFDASNFGGTGVAFEDYGSEYNLGYYVGVPFNVESWFTNGQQGYSAMTDCYGELYDSSNSPLLRLGADSQDTSMGPDAAYYIELFHT